MRSSEVVNELSNGHTEGNVRIELTVSALSECVRAGNIKTCLTKRKHTWFWHFLEVARHLQEARQKLAASLARTTLRFSPVFFRTNTITFAAGTVQQLNLELRKRYPGSKENRQNVFRSSWNKQATRTKTVWLNPNLENTNKECEK